MTTSSAAAKATLGRRTLAVLHDHPGDWRTIEQIRDTLGVLQSGGLHAALSRLVTARAVEIDTRHRPHRYRATTIAFGAQVTVAHPPATVPSQVSQLRADASDHVIVEAIARADTVIGVSDPARGRLLIVLSDGVFGDRVTATQQAITRLRRAGCPILWITTGRSGEHRYSGPTIVTLTDPARCGHIIGRATVRALADTRRR